MVIIIAVSIAVGFALGLFWRDLWIKVKAWWPGFVKRNIVDNDPYDKLGAEHIIACRKIIEYGTCFNHPDLSCMNDPTTTDGVSSFKCPGPDVVCESWNCCDKVESAKAYLAERPGK